MGFVVGSGYAADDLLYDALYGHFGDTAVVEQRGSELGHDLQWRTDGVVFLDGS